MKKNRATQIGEGKFSECLTHNLRKSTKSRQRISIPCLLKTKEQTIDLMRMYAIQKKQKRKHNTSVSVIVIIPPSTLLSVTQQNWH